MSWESERPNVILTLETIDELEEIYTSASKLFEGIKQGDYYVIKSRDPDYVYGICNSKNIFKALKRVMESQAFTSDNNREYINHWRWIPRRIHYANEKKARPEGGSLIHYYNSRYPNDEDPDEREYSKMDNKNQSTVNYWAEMNANVIETPFYRGGDPLKKLGIGMKIEDLWWCQSNRNVGFSSQMRKELILLT